MTDHAKSDDGTIALHWKTLAYSIFQEARSNRVVESAASVAFFAMLAVFPAIAGFVAFYALFADAGLIADHLRWARGIMPAGTFELLAEQVHHLTNDTNSSLSITFAVGLLFSLWSANSGILSLIDALNLVHDEVERRTWISLYMISFIFTGGAILVSLLTFAFVIALPLVFSPLGLTEEVVGFAFSWTRWPFLLAGLLTLLCLLYLFGPSRPTARLGDVIWGAVFATVLILAASLAYSWYVSSFGTLAATYGSIGAVAGFMIWLWLSVIMILLGALYNVGLSRRKARKSAALSAKNHLEQKSDE